MKHISLLSCGLAMLLGTASCSNEKDYIWDELPTERVMALLKKTSETLNEGDGVWRLSYMSDLGPTSFTFYFNGSTNVAMYEKTDSSFSTYNLNYGEGPLLTFDTYGLIHEYANPSGDAPFGNGGDYEFIIKSVTPDSIVTEGRVYDRPMVFKRATIGEEYRMRFMMQLNLALGMPTNYFWGVTSASGVEFDVEQRNNEATLLVTDANKKTQEVAITTDAKGVVFTPAIDLEDGTNAARLDWNLAKGDFDYSDFTMRALNYPTHSLGETAVELYGKKLTLAEVSPSLTTVYNNLYSNETFGHMIKTIEFSIPEEMDASDKMSLENRIAFSVVLEVKLNEEETELSWNNFLSGYTWTLGEERGDCMKASHAMRNGDYVAHIYQVAKAMVSTVEDAKGCTIDKVGDSYYVISRSNSKNWMRFVPSTFEGDDAVK